MFCFPAVESLCTGYVIDCIISTPINQYYENEISHKLKIGGLMVPPKSRLQQISVSINSRHEYQKGHFTTLSISVSPSSSPHHSLTLFHTIHTRRTTRHARHALRKGMENHSKLQKRNKNKGEKGKLVSNWGCIASKGYECLRCYSELVSVWSIA